MRNLKLQLIMIKQMLPYFHACGHFNYAKSAQLCVQKLEDFINEMKETCILHAQEDTKHNSERKEFYT